MKKRTAIKIISNFLRAKKLKSVMEEKIEAFRKLKGDIEDILSSRIS